MTTPETGHPLLQALIDSISVFDGAACWDFAAMYAVRDALVAAQAAPTTPDEVTVALRQLRDIVVEHNRSGASWGPLFASMMAALAKAHDALAAQAAPAEPVHFLGVDPMNPTAGAVLPMIPDSWRFGFSRVDGRLCFGLQDNGPFVAYAAAQPVARRVRKIGGSFQHTGTVVAEFETTAGERRIVIEFDPPVAGMLHVYRPDQVAMLAASPQADTQPSEQAK